MVNEMCMIGETCCIESFECFFEYPTSSVKSGIQYVNLTSAGNVPCNRGNCLVTQWSTVKPII